MLLGPGLRDFGLATAYRTADPSAANIGADQSCDLDFQVPIWPTLVPLYEWPTIQAYWDSFQ